MPRPGGKASRTLAFSKIPTQPTVDFLSVGVNGNDAQCPDAMVSHPMAGKAERDSPCRHLGQSQTPSRSEIVDDHCGIDFARCKLRAGGTEESDAGTIHLCRRGADPYLRECLKRGETTFPYT